jgi:hypothetical protein
VPLPDHVLMEYAAALGVHLAGQRDLPAQMGAHTCSELRRRTWWDARP